MITAHQVRQISFARSRGASAYDATAVDNMLRRVVITLEALEQGRTVSPDGSRLLLPRDIRTGEPPAAAGQDAGYSAAEVDAFRAQLVATLEEYVRRHAGSRRKAPGADERQSSASQAAAPAATATTPSPAPTVSAATVSAATVSAAAAVAASRPAPTQDLSSAPEGLSAYDVVLGLQTARAALFGDQRDRLFVRTPDGALTRVVAVDTVAEGIVVHAR